MQLVSLRGQGHDTPLIEYFENGGNREISLDKYFFSYTWCMSGLFEHNSYSRVGTKDINNHSL